MLQPENMMNVIILNSLFLNKSVFAHLLYTNHLSKISLLKNTFINFTQARASIYVQKS